MGGFSRAEVWPQWPAAARHRGVGLTHPEDRGAAVRPEITAAHLRFYEELGGSTTPSVRYSFELGEEEVPITP